MAELYLVRHGQASFGEDNYDQLSPLGVEQAELLGKHFAAQNMAFDRVMIGTQQRHLQTAEGIFRGLEQAMATETLPELNEYDFNQLMVAYTQQHPEISLPMENKQTFYRHLKQALLLWTQDRLEGSLPETWNSFQQRIAYALQRIQQSGAKRLLVVSSGGPIGTIAHIVLGAPATTGIELNLQIKNSSYSHYFFNDQHLRMASFNNLPHLQQPQHLTKITYA